MPTWFTALLTVVAGGAVGALFNWLAGRHRDQRDGNKDHREEDQADVDRLRNIANDALDREKFAWQRVTDAETKAEEHRVETETLRTEVKALRARVDQLEVDAEEAKRRAIYAEAEAERLKRHIQLLEAHLQRQGVQVPHAD